MELIILIAALAGLVWGTLLVMRGSLTAGCLLYLVTACCLGPYFLKFDVAGITLTLDRLLITAVVIAWCVQWRLGGVVWRPLDRTDYVVLAFFTLLIVNTFSHDWRYSTGQEDHIVQHLINGYLIPLSLYMMARSIPVSESRTTLIVAWLAIFGVYLAATGVFEFHKVWALVFPHYMADEKLGMHFGRARGPMLHSVIYGTYLGTCFLAAWLWRQRLPRWGQLVMLCLLPVYLLAIFYSQTRSVWLGSATGLMLVLFLTLEGRLRTAVLGSMIGAGLLVGVAKMDKFLSFEREGSTANTLHSANLRPAFAFVSWKMVQDRPLFGFGFGHFPEEKMPYLNDRTTRLQLKEIRPYAHHNTYLSILTELGIVGFVLWFGMFFSWFLAAWKLARCDTAPAWARRHGVLFVGMLGVVLWQMAGHELTFTPLDNSLIFLLAGVATTLCAKFVPAASVASPERQATASPAATRLQPTR